MSKAVKRKQPEIALATYPDPNHGWRPIETAPHNEFVLISHGITHVTPAYAIMIARYLPSLDRRPIGWYGQSGLDTVPMTPKYWQPLPLAIP